jgi:hypothetical protein
MDVRLRALSLRKAGCVERAVAYSSASRMSGSLEVRKEHLVHLFHSSSSFVEVNRFFEEQDSAGYGWWYEVTALLIRALEYNTPNLQ